jgi:hypothetical protein
MARDSQTKKGATVLRSVLAAVKRSNALLKMKAPPRGPSQKTGRKVKKQVLKKKQSLGPSQGQKVTTSRIGARMGIPPITWKLACADAPTRSTQDYSKFVMNFVQSPQIPNLQLNQFGEETIYVYLPDFAEHQLCAFNGANAALLEADLRGQAPGPSYVAASASPNLFSITPANERLAITSAALTLCTRYGASTGVLNIRRITLKDTRTSLSDLITSLTDDVLTTYHLNLTGNQRWNMHCGIHDSVAYGELHRDAVPNWSFGPSSSVGGLIWSFTNTLTGAALATPGFTILAGAQWTQELSANSAHTKDNAPERSVVTAKEIHSHQARQPPFSSPPSHPDKGSIGVMNSMGHGLANISAHVAEGTNVMEAGLGLISNVVDATAVMSRAIALGVAATG